MKRIAYQGAMTLGLAVLVVVAPWQQLPVASGQEQEDAAPQPQITVKDASPEPEIIQAPENNEGEGLAADPSEEQAPEENGEGLAEDDAAHVLAEDIDYDLNGDGVLSVGDLAIVAAAYGLDTDAETWEQHAHADLNADGKVDITDLTSMAAAIRGGGQASPAPDVH